jgi:putative spermidine/putrescine transport system ATP-binding protein
VRLLVRPERIEVVSTASGENIFAVKVEHDRFFGASRELELSVGQGMLKIDTPTREGFAHIHVPRNAVQFLPTN